MTTPRPADVCRCVGCDAGLLPHNVTKLCAECKLIARNRRLGGLPTDTAEPVTATQAFANVSAVLGGVVIAEQAAR